MVYCQRLSEDRGRALRDYLMKQGMPVNSVRSKGLVKTQPVSSHETAEGEQQNSRVELVISGEQIGTEIKHANRGQVTGVGAILRAL
jgi:outer membrane protein OmpA-like peptidoglycan-associated protein